jgi:hypothetical protein
VTLPEEMRAAIQAWAEEHMVGRPASRESLEVFRRGCVEVISELADVEPECVRVQGARFARGATGTTLMVDGFTLVDPTPRRKA